MPARMIINGPARLADRLAIIALNDCFGRSLDTGDLALFLSLFADDIDYRNGARHHKGKDALEAFFRRRLAGNRVSRHFYSGLIIDFVSPDHASGISNGLTFAGSGTLPLKTTLPYLVADIEDRYRRSANGAWLITSRIISPIFHDDSVPPPTA